MATKTPTHGNEKPEIKQLFIEWLALPTPLRKPKNQAAFAKEHKVRDATLTAWKQDEKVWEQVQKIAKPHIMEKFPNVMLALYQGIIERKRAAEIELWLTWATGFQRKMELETPGLNEEIDKMRDTLRGMIEAVKSVGKR